MTAPIDSRQLRAFSILARTGSFTDAARELHLTQSAVSHAIKALEEELRCRLFDRLGKTVVLTQAGEQFFVHVEKILAEMAAARGEIERLGKWGAGRLRIGASPTSCQFILPSVLREFRESFPQCVIQIEPGSAPEILETLRQHRIDLAIALEPEREEQFDSRHLFTDELQFLVGPLHPWARARKVERATIAQQSYIFYSKASYTFRLVERYFREENLVLRSPIELGSMEAIKEMVKIGVGISIVTPWIAEREIAAKSLVALPLGRRKLRRRWSVLHWRGRRLSLAEETFIGLCVAAARAFDSSARRV